LNGGRVLEAALEEDRRTHARFVQHEHTRIGVKIGDADLFRMTHSRARVPRDAAQPLASKSDHPASSAMISRRFSSVVEGPAIGPGVAEQEGLADLPSAVEHGQPTVVARQAAELGQLALALDQLGHHDPAKLYRHEIMDL
jgi:hypothetical protein